MNICIVEDDRDLRESLRALLSGEPGMTVSGAFGSAEAALEKNDWAATDTLLVDLGLPGMDGVGLIRAVRERYPALRIAVFTLHEKIHDLMRAIRAGADGYIIKGCRSSQLIANLHDLHGGGGAAMSPTMLRALLGEVRTTLSGSPPRALTEREREVARLLAQEGMTRGRIAQRLSISSDTAAVHLRNIYRKLGVKTKADACAKAKITGIV